MKTTMVRKEQMLMALCSRCAGQFYSAGCYRLKRADKDQEIRDVCTFCGCHRGYDYYIYPKRNRIMNGRRNRPVRIVGC